MSAFSVYKDQIKLINKRSKKKPKPNSTQVSDKRITTHDTIKNGKIQRKAKARHSRERSNTSKIDGDPENTRMLLIKKNKQMIQSVPQTKNLSHRKSSTSKDKKIEAKSKSLLEKAPLQASVVCDEDDQHSEAFSFCSNDLFNWLIAPVSPTDFFSNYWEKNPLFIKRGNKDYYKRILTTATLDKILRNNSLHFTKNIDVVSYVNGKRETHNLEGRAMPAVLWDFYTNGCSIRVLNPHTYNPKVCALLANLQEFFGCMVGANVYLTPPDSQGFAPHYDDIEAFVIQLEGRKHWKLYAPLSAATTLPRYSSKNFSPEELDKPLKELTLEAGDILYFPRGIIHEGYTDADAHSLHITLSVYQRTAYADLLEHMLQEALKIASEDDIEYREGLPLQYLKHMGLANIDKSSSVRTTMINKIQKLVTNLTKYLPIDAAVDQMGKQFMWDAMPPVLTNQEIFHTVHKDGETMDDGKVTNRVEMDLDTMIRLIRYHCLRLVIELDGSARIYHCVDNAKVYHGEEQQFLEIDKAFIPAIKLLVNCYPQFIRVDSLPLENDSQKMQIAADLWERALLTSQEPLPVIDSD